MELVPTPRTTADGQIIATVLTAPTARGHVFFLVPSTAASVKLDVVLADVNSLALEEEDVDGYTFRPTNNVLSQTRKLLREAYGPSSGKVPRPFVSPTGRGGIRIEWTCGERIVSLVLSDTSSYIHHLTGEEHGSDADVSVASLDHWLRWLME